MRQWLIAAAAGIAAELILLVPDYGLSAHEAMSGWQYPPECCSDKDCAEYPSENVTIKGDGFLLKEGEYIPRTKARVSPDGHYHICRYPWSEGIISTGSVGDPVPCFWYPPQGM